MGDLVEVQAVQREIRNLVDEPAILGTHSEVVSEIEIDAAAVNERGFSLSFDAIDRDPICRIEDQRAAASQRVGPNFRRVHREVRNK